MIMNIKILLTGITIVALWGCDPMRRINMKNNTAEKAVISWYIKEDSINSSPFFISSSREVEFTLHPGPDSKRIKMSFGSGKWSQAVVTNLVDDLDSLVIKWNHHVAVLKTQQQIEEYLMARRRGWDKSKIHMILKEDQ